MSDSSTIARGVLEFGGDATELTAAIAKAKEDLQTLDAAAKRHGGAAANALAGVGKQGASGLADLDAATQRTAKSLLMQAGVLGQSAGAAAIYKAQMRGLDAEALKPFAASLDQAIAKQELAGRSAVDFATKIGLVGVSSGHAREAMRLLPMQIGDFVTQIAGGQNALLAFVQQGAQVKDSVGGVGNAFRLLASVFTPVRVAIGGGVAALAGLGVAYKMGADESESFRKAVILSGNAIGETMATLRSMSASVGAVVGGQAAAADAMTQYIATGQRAAIGLDKIAEAAVRLKRVGGPAVEDTVKSFSDLAKDPLNASIKLNESTNFLTLSVYKQIKALDDQGKKTEAAALAQKAFAEDSISKAKEIEVGLGTIERRWLDITDAIVKAKNAALAFGRVPTTDQAIADVDKRLLQLQMRRDSGKRIDSNTFTDLFKSQDQIEAEANALQILRAQLVAGAETSRKLATAQSERAVATRAAIAADKAATKAVKEHDAELEAMREAAKHWADAMMDFQKIQRDIATADDHWTRSQSRMIELADSDVFKRMNESAKIAVLQAFLMAHNDEIAYKAKKDLAKATGEVTKAAMENADAIAKDIKSQDDANRGLQEKIDSLKSSKEYLLLNKAATLELTAAMYEQAGAQALVDGAQDSGAVAAAYQQRAKQIREEIALRRELFGAEQQKEAADQAARDWQRAADDIRSALTDAFRRAFESGEDFGSAFAKVIANEIRARIATALADALAGEVISLVLGAQPAGGKAGSTLQTASNVASLGSLYERASVGASGIGTAVTGAYGRFAVSQYGQRLGMSTTYVDATGHVFTEPTAASASNASIAGSAANYAAGVAAGVYGGRAISGGYSAIGGNSGNSAVNTGTAIGAFWGPFGAAVGGAVGGLVNRAFGRSAPEVAGHSITGTVTGGDFAGSAVTDIVQRGGWFRSDKHSSIVEAITGDLDKALDEGATSVLAHARKYGAALGLPVAKLAEVSQSIDVQITDDADANAKAIEAALKQYSDALIGAFAADVEPLRRAGETTAQVIDRVGGAIVDVNSVLEALGHAALTASLDSGKAAVALEAAFGDLGTMQQAAGSYLQNFYSDAERADLTRAAVTKSLDSVGLAIPATREAFRSLVDAQDLMTESGRNAFATLMGVQDAFASVVGSAQDLTAVERERADLNKQLLEAQGDTAALRNMERNALDESNRALYDQVRALEDQKIAAEAAAEASRKEAAAQQSLWNSIDQTIEKFLSPQQQLGYGYTTAANSLQAAGVLTDVPDLAGVLKDASKAQVYDFAAQFVQLEGVSTEAKLAVVQAAGALSDLADKALEFERAGLQSQLDAITSEYGDVVGALSDGTLTLTESYRANSSELANLTGGLAQLLGTVKQTPQQMLAAALQSQQGIRSFRASLGDAAQSALIGGMAPQARVAALRAREATLFAQLGSAADPVAVAQKLQQTVIDRIREESALSTQVYDDQITSLTKLRDLSAELAQFTGSLKFSDISPLNPTAQLDAARALYDTTFRSASAGDATAQGNLTTNARAYLDEARSYFASSAGYAAIFSGVTGQLDALGATGANVDPQITALQNVQTSVDTTGQQTYDALMSIDAALSRRDSEAAEAVAEQTKIAKAQVEQLASVVDQQKAQIAQWAAIAQALIDKLQHLGDVADAGLAQSTLVASQDIVSTP